MVLSKRRRCIFKNNDQASGTRSHTANNWDLRIVRGNLPFATLRHPTAPARSRALFNFRTKLEINTDMVICGCLWQLLMPAYDLGGCSLSHETLSSKPHLHPHDDNCIEEEPHDLHSSCNVHHIVLDGPHVVFQPALPANLLRHCSPTQFPPSEVINQP